MHYSSRLSKTIFILLAIFGTLQVSAQNQRLVDLRAQLASANDPQSKVNGLTRVAYEMRIFDADSALVLANAALGLATKVNYEKGIGISQLCIGLAHSMKANYELANEFANKAMLVGKQLKYDSLIASSKLAIAAYHYNKSNYDKAIENSLEAVKIFESLKDDNGLAKTKSLMAQVYQLKGDIPRAEQMLKEIGSLQTTDMRSKVIALHTLANIYGMQGKFDEALALDKEGIKMSDDNNLLFLKSQFYDNMANCFMYSDRPDSAKKYFLECIKIDSSFSNEKQMADTYLNMGELSKREKKYDEALAYLDHSIMLSKKTGYRQGTYAAYLVLSDLYSAKKDGDAAIKTLKLAYQMKDSIINETKENKIAELETIYETEKKETQLKLKEAELTKKNYFLLALGISSSLVILAGFSLYRRRRLQHKVSLQHEVIHQQQIATRAVLEAEENERKRIAGDLHDGVGQMMSAAKMNLSAFEDELVFTNDQQRRSFENVISLIDESCKEIRDVSHQMMPNALLKSGLSSAIKEFINKIDNRVMKVSLHAEGLNERIDSNIETVLYRVIQECVNNVLKHSGGNHLDISLIRDNEGIAATIEDNGHGFDSNTLTSSDGIGVKNIISRITYLKGTIDFDSAPGRGTLVAIYVPIEN